MPDIPEEAVQAAAEVLYRDHASEYGADHLSWRDFTTPARAVLNAAVPAFAAREEEIRANERRKVAEQIAAALLAVDPVEWALAGQHAGHDAARIARQIGEARDSR